MHDEAELSAMDEACRDEARLYNHTALYGMERMWQQGYDAVEIANVYQTCPVTVQWALREFCTLSGMDIN